MRRKDLFIIIIYIIIGVLTRTVWHVAPNVEFVTALSLAGAFFIRKTYSILIPLGIMIITDLIIGNSSIIIFTWSAFALVWVWGRVGSSKKIKNLFKFVPKKMRMILLSEIMGIVFTLFFFLWTNFGVVIVSGMYPKTIEGLMLSYTMGLPFLVPQLVGNIIIVPSIFVISSFVYNAKAKEILQKLHLTVSKVNEA
jgi:hypothetical protein